MTRSNYNIFHYPFLVMLTSTFLLSWKNNVRTTAAAAASFQTSSVFVSKTQYRTRRHLSNESTNESIPASENANFFANEKDYPTFASIGIQNSNLLKQLSSQKIKQPSSIQAATFPKIYDCTSGDIIIGSETGSGKTLSYLLPLFDDILKRKEAKELGYEYCRAIILVPNKELAQQVLRMSVEICGGKCVYSSLVDSPSIEKEDDGNNDKVRLAIIPGGLASPYDFKLFRDSEYKNYAQVDIGITTPAAISKWGTSTRFIDFFANIPTLIVDEADMLLDGGYIQQLNQILVGFRRADRVMRRESLYDQQQEEDDNNNISNNKSVTQHVFVGATLPNSGLRSVYAYLEKRFPLAEKLIMPNFHNARHTGLSSSSPTTWIEMNELTKRLDMVVDMLRNELLEDKVMLFVNTAADADQVTELLIRSDINALPYHAKIQMDEKLKNLSIFRAYNPSSSSSKSSPPPVLVCTDLASRGIDIQHVTIILQLQFASNVITHLHRMGRCGRAGLKVGRGIIFYNNQDEKDLVDVVRDAESKQEGMILEKDVIDVEEEQGKVTKAFSRRRGFRKKIRKENKAKEEV